MAIARQIIKQWFSNFKKPTQEQFWAWIDSFVHKDDKIPMQSVEGLETALQNIPTSDQFNNHLADEQAHRALFDGKVDKEEGKGLISESERTLIQENYNKRVVGQTITGDVNKVSTLVLEDGSIIQAYFTDVTSAESDVMLNSLNFDTQTGVLTGVRSDGQQLTVDLNGRFALLNHSYSYNDLTDKPALFSGSYNDLTNKPTHIGVEGLPFREVTLSVTMGQPFKIPKLDTYEYVDAIKIISNTPITGLSNVELLGEGEKSVVIPASWQKTSNSSFTSYYELDLYTESPQVTMVYYINHLETYLNRFGAREYFFKKYKIEGNEVNSLLSQIKPNVENFTKLVIGKIPEIYNSISQISGLQNKGFLSYIPEPYCRLGDTGRVGRNAKIIYTDLSGQSFVLNRYFSGYQGGDNKSHFVDASFNFTWKQYQKEQDSSENKQSKYEIILSSSIQLTSNNSGIHFIYNDTSLLTINISSTSLEKGLEWSIYFTGGIQPNGQQNGGYGSSYGGGYGNYPTPIQIAVNTQITCYTALQNNEVKKGDKIRIFVKNGAIYIVKD